MAVKKRFDTTADSVELAEPTLDAIQRPTAGGIADADKESLASSDDNDDDNDDAPEAVSTSAARQAELNREKTSRAEEQSKRATQRKLNRAREDKLRASKGKARAVEEDEEEEEPSTSSSRLDPALFAQAEKAFEAARQAVEDEEDDDEDSEAGYERRGLKQQKSQPQQTRKRWLNELDLLKQEEENRLAKRVIGNTTVQALGPSASSSSLHPAIAAQSSLNKLTSLPSKSSSSFLHARLYKRKNPGALGKNPKSSKKSNKTEEDNTPLIFDPLLDRAPEKKDKKGSKKKKSRLEVMEAMRGRSSAQSAYSSKSRRGGNEMGPALGFASASKERKLDAGLSKRKQRSGGRREKV